MEVRRRDDLRIEGLSLANRKLDREAARFRAYEVRKCSPFKFFRFEGATECC